jgi:hypothetical protein
MSRESFVFVLGLIVFLTSFLGVLWSTKKIVFIICGAVLMVVGYSLRRAAFLRSIDTGAGERASDAFVESPTENDSETEDAFEVKKI